MVNGLFYFKIHWNKYSNCTNVDPIFRFPYNATSHQNRKFAITSKKNTVLAQKRNFAVSATYVPIFEYYF